MAVHCPEPRQSVNAFLTRAEVTGAFSSGCSAFDKLWLQQVALTAVKGLLPLHQGLLTQNHVFEGLCRAVVSAAGG